MDKIVDTGQRLRNTRLDSFSKWLELCSVVHPPVITNFRTSKRGVALSIRNDALVWLKRMFPNEIHSTTRASKFFPERELWFFTLPTTYFEMNENQFLNIVCEHESEKNNFHLLKIPFSFIKKNKGLFDTRKNGEAFDLHISARKTEKFIEKRSKGRVDFSYFKQESF